MWRELAHWQLQASAIADSQLRELALEKLDGEAFNAEVASTLATLAPRRARERVVEAIVALEVLFDYLDGRTERAGADPLAEGRRAFEPFIAAVEAGAGVDATAGRSQADQSDDDGAYVWALSEHVRERAGALPSFAVVGDLAAAAAQRCAEAQTRLHAAAALGDQQLQEWAQHASAGSGLRWQEYVGSCASSVLVVHALIAAAARPALARAEAVALDEAYLAIAALITALDSLVDEKDDAQRGERGFIRLFEDGDGLQARLTVLTRLALARAREAPNGAHHAMTLAGVAAYYTTHPGARSPRMRQIAAAVRAELAPTIWPALAVMHSWRLAKRGREHLRGVAGRLASAAAAATRPARRT
jgi:hypothetical protein